MHNRSLRKAQASYIKVRGTTRETTNWRSNPETAKLRKAQTDFRSAYDDLNANVSDMIQYLDEYLRTEPDGGEYFFAHITKLREALFKAISQAASPAEDNIYETIYNLTKQFQ